MAFEEEEEEAEEASVQEDNSTVTANELALADAGLAVLPTLIDFLHLTGFGSSYWKCAKATVKLWRAILAVYPQAMMPDEHYALDRAIREVDEAKKLGFPMD